MAGKSIVTIVLIDDDPSQLRLMESRLKQNDPLLHIQRILSFTDAADALTQLPTDESTVILCDHDMPGGSGLMWLPDLLKADAGPVIMLSAMSDEKITAAAFRAGASDYLIKTEAMSQPIQLRRSIVDALRRYKLNKRNHETSRELKRVNQQLEIRNLQLSKMTKTAHRFIDDVAHDFRTPLTVIQEFASILRDGLGGEVNDQQCEYIKRIDSGARDLNRIIDDFLDASKLKSGMLNVQRRPTHIEDVFDEVQRTLQENLGKGPLPLTFQHAPNLPAVFCDAALINRALVNLITREIKQTAESDRVTVTAELAENGDVALSVHTTAPRESLADLSSLCEYQCDAAGQSLVHSEGLGLALNAVRSFVWINLGNMVIDDSIGAATSIGFTLPAANPEHVLARYIDRIAEADRATSVATFQVTPKNKDLSSMAVFQIISKACRSMDLLLPAADGQSMLLMGPCTQPDRWVQRINDTWEMHQTDATRVNPPELAYLGSRPAEKLADLLLPVMSHNLSDLKIGA